ncbi:hypothetical protein DSM112329_04046 [Paraconexibacter sp. AEG42_29]|uniref:Uncharacterized protein n=1 Tax=Paraconexibacter sp. AEG42_29 TaxID=2997339 RepID=A0AAU7AZJ0_9ACTN
MAYSTAEAQQELLDAIGAAADHVGVALVELGEAYEQVDDFTGERLEGELFGPIQKAYGRLKKTHAGFAARNDLPPRTFAAATPGHPSQGVKGFVDSAVAAAGRADATLVTLQDSMMLVDVGDAELRAGLAEVRRILHEIPGRARLFVRTLGR